MDFYLHYPNPNFHSSSVVVTNNSFPGREGEKKRNNKVSSKVKLSTDPQSVAARERRHRISEKFKILRSLIPGGNMRNMDTVSMLEEAIEYVKFLKAQIWLHQTMISFENVDGYDNADQYPHEHLLTNDMNLYGGLPEMEHDMLPQLGFEEGSCYKVEGEDSMVSLSHII